MYELLNNWKVVLFSIGGATTFWFFNALNKDYNAVINYPVEFQFAQDSVIVMRPLPNEVTIDVSSGGWNLIRNTLFFNVTPIQIPLENPTEISYFTRSSIFPIIVDQLDGLTVNYMITDTLHINIEKKKVKRIPVYIDSLNISMEEGYRLTSAIDVNPDSIVLVGPETFIDTLGARFLVALKEREIDGNFEKSVSVALPNDQLIKASPKQIDVSFMVERYEQMEIMLDVDPINFPLDSSVFLAENQVKITFTIPASKKEIFSASDFAISADLAMLNKEDSSIIAILIYYPEQAIEVMITPEHVKVDYAK